MSTNCERCNNCLGKTKKTQCLLRRCKNFIPQFDVKQDQAENAKLIIQKITNGGDETSKTPAIHRLDDEIVDFFHEEFEEDDKLPLN